MSSERRRLTGLVAICLAALGLWLAARHADRAEHRVQLAVSCDGQRCQARVNDGDPIEIMERPGEVGGRFGLYAYHPFEFPAVGYFRQLAVRSEQGVGFETKLSMLQAGPDLERLERGADWRLEPGRGLTHHGPLGSRAVALVGGIEGEFSLELELEAVTDAGLMLRAVDRDNGTVFVVRPRYNDAFFFRLENGTPGPILAMAPLGELRLPRELLRLGGLLAEIVLVAALLLGAIRLVVPWIPRGSPSTEERPSSPIDDRPPRWSLPLLALLTVGVLAGVSLFGLSGIPHAADETAYLFQAKVFAAGELWAPPPPMPEFFQYEHIITGHDRWMSKYPPLFSLILALGVLLGAPWLINPLLGAALGWMTYLLGREIAGWRWGLVAWLLLLSSPFFVILGASMMSHMASALLVTAFLWLTLRGADRCSPALLGAAGACLGLAIFARPFTALLISIPAGLFLLWKLAFERRRGRALVSIALLGGVTLVFAAAFVGWNALSSGSPATSLQLHAAYDATDTLGFGVDKGRGWLMTWGSWGHTPAKALRSVHMYLDYTSRHLLGWPGRLSFALILVGLALRSRRSFDWLLLGPLGALAAGHMLYWATQHLLYGARYWFAAVPGLMVLSALGLRALLSVTSLSTGPLRRRLVTLGVVGLVACNLALYFPARFAALENYAGIDADLRNRMATLDPTPSVVFVKTEGLMYNDGFYLNDPFLKSETLFVRDLGERNDELLRRFPGYRGLRWNGESLEPLPLPTALESGVMEASQ